MISLEWVVRSTSRLILGDYRCSRWVNQCAYWLVNNQSIITEHHSWLNDTCWCLTSHGAGQHRPVNSGKLLVCSNVTSASFQFFYKESFKLTSMRKASTTLLSCYSFSLSDWQRQNNLHYKMLMINFNICCEMEKKLHFRIALKVPTKKCETEASDEWLARPVHSTVCSETYVRLVMSG